MDALQAISNLSQAPIAAAVAIKALKLANAQQHAVADMLDAAVQVAEQIQDAGLGEQVDVYA